MECRMICGYGSRGGKTGKWQGNVTAVRVGGNRKYRVDKIITGSMSAYSLPTNGDRFKCNYVNIHITDSRVWMLCIFLAVNK